jgi:hypothetical protein
MAMSWLRRTVGSCIARGDGSGELLGGVECKATIGALLSVNVRVAPTAVMLMAYAWGHLATLHERVCKIQ